MSFELARHRIQADEICSVVMSDSGSRINSSVFDDDSASDRPAGKQSIVNADPAVLRRDSECPKSPAGFRGEGVHASVGASDEDSPFRDRRRIVNRAGGVGFPDGLTIVVDRSDDAGSVGDEDESSRGDGRGRQFRTADFGLPRQLNAVG